MWPVFPLCSDVTPRPGIRTNWMSGYEGPSYLESNQPENEYKTSFVSIREVEITI